MSAGLLETVRLHTSSTGWVERRRYDDGALVVRKVQRQPRKLHQELHALRDWAPALQPWVPRLTAEDSSAGWFELEARPGVAPAAPWSEAVFREAGRFLARLHALPRVDDDPVPLASALEHRLDRFQVEAARCFDPSWVAEVCDGVRTAAFAGPLVRVPCHRDFAPYNWLVDMTEGAPERSTFRLSVIDFEHARLDWAQLDRARIDALVLASKPSLRAAFDEGYGEPTSSFDPERRALAGWEAMRTHVWGVAHGDRGFRARGARMLEALGYGHAVE